MITSRRDYILRIIDEVGRLLARVVFKRKNGADQEALETVVQAAERLFALERTSLFQLKPEQQFAMLLDGESPEIGRDKVLLYAALNAEAGEVYFNQRNDAMARATFQFAAWLCEQARANFSMEQLPAYAPDPLVLRQRLEATTPSAR